VSNDNSALIVLGLGAVAFYGYEQGWFSSLLGTSATGALPSGYTAIPTNVMSLADQNAFITWQLGLGTTPANIQDYLNAFAASYGACMSPATWAGPLTTAQLKLTGFNPVSSQGCQGAPVGPTGVPIASNPTTTSATGSGTATSIPTALPLSQELQQAAGSVSTLDADQWSYYWTQIGQTALSSDQFGSIFFPTGRPASQSSYPQYTAAQFIAALSGAGVPGVSGLGWLGNYGGIPVSAIHGGW
jgi:hypothetical protein